MSCHKHHQRDRAASGPSQRQLRVGELIRHALAEMLSRGDIHDPVIEGHMITVPEVAMTADLRLATIYVMPLGGRDAKPVIEALERNKKFLRGEIARRINLKFAPDIRFRFDERFDEAERIEKILRTPEVRRDLEPKDGRRGSMSENELPDAQADRAARAAQQASPAQAREARRARLGHSRQAGRHDVDPRGRDRQAPVHGEPRRPRRHARSARLGLLPLALGEATKTVPFVMDGRKRYRFTVRWGEERDTDDAEGKVIGTSEARPDGRAVTACLPAFTGTIAQVPPQILRHQDRGRARL